MTATETQGQQDFDRSLMAWLDARTQGPPPAGLVHEALECTRNISPRPAWRIPEWWIPAPVVDRRPVLPPVAALLIVLGLVGAIAGGAMVVVSHPAVTPVLPPPTGLAGNGLVAFAPGGDIWVADAGTTVARQLTAGPRFDFGPVWSPDGTRIGYWSLGMTGFDEPYDDGEVSAASERDPMVLVVMDADGRHATEIVTGLRRSTCGGDITWSPDSTQLAFDETRVGADGTRGEEMIEAVRRDGSDRRVLVLGGNAPSWSPDGMTLAYRTSDTIGRIAVAEPTPAIVENPGEGVCDVGRPSWSPDGVEIAYHLGAPGLRYLVVKSPSGTWMPDREGDDADPRFAPAGSVLALSRQTQSLFPSGPRQFTVWEWGARRSDPTNLVHPGVQPGPPVWSPDGRMLLGVLPGDDPGSSNGLLLLDTTEKQAPVTIANPVPGTPIQGDPSWQRVAR